MQILAELLASATIQEIKNRMVEESFHKIKTCLDLLTEEEVWHRPNAEVNSVGNLMLHLCGNVRQYVISGAGKAADTRTRQAEFDEKGPIAKAELIKKMEETLTEVSRTLDSLTPEELVQMRPVQCYEFPVVAMLIHATEHFSYHVGQIIYYTKLIKNVDMRFYSGHNLDEKGANSQQ